VLLHYADSCLDIGGVYQPLKAGVQ
jgi:hypothetical protein